MRQAAHTYADRYRWAVFPLRGKLPSFPRCELAQRGHRPDDELGCDVGHGLHDATLDLATIDRWWQANLEANVGIATGETSGIAVVDVDLDKNPNALVDLEALVGELPPTLTVRTGGGGLHYIYERPDGGIRNSSGKLSDSVDIRGDGGYIVAPPSIHPDTRTRYQWEHKVAPAPFPQVILDRLAELDRKPEPTSAPDIGVAGDPWGTRILEAEIARIATAPEGTRNETLFKAACNVFEAMKGGHIDTGVAWDQLESIAQRIGLDKHESDGTLESAYDRAVERHPEERPDRPLPDVAAEPRPAVAPIVDAPKGRSSRLLTLTDLEKIPPARWLLEGFLPEGFSVLFGPPKAGKTFVALDWSLTVAATMGPVVYCAGEGAGGIRSRIGGWRARHPELDPSGNFRTLTLGDFPYLLDQSSVDQLAWDLESLDGPRLVVIDTWARTIGGSGGNENDAGEVGRAIKALDQMRDRFGCSVLVLHHAPAPSEMRKHAKRPRGSTALDGAADAMWRLDPPDDEERQSPIAARQDLKCVWVKDFETPRPITIKLDPSGDSLVPNPSASFLLGRRGF